MSSFHTNTLKDKLDAIVYTFLKKPDFQKSFNFAVGFPQNNFVNLCVVATKSVSLQSSILRQKWQWSFSTMF